MLYFQESPLFFKSLTLDKQSYISTDIALTTKVKSQMFRHMKYK